MEEFREAVADLLKETRNTVSAYERGSGVLVSPEECAACAHVEKLHEEALVTGPSDVSCSNCGDLVFEFSVDADIWNEVVRKGGPEHDNEYWCVQCFAEECVTLVASTRKALEEARDVAERIAQLIAHRACGGCEHDPSSGKLHGYCVVCLVPWPCEYAGQKPTESGK